jgi:isopenicillin-N epimerase
MHNLKSLFLLNPDITFLNFGSFGATPKVLFDELQRFQLELESEPVQFIVNRGPEYLRQSREALGNYIGCDAENVVYVPNPTCAINIIAKNLKLNSGDEILSTDLEYGAMDRTWNYYARENGYRYVRQPIRLPLQSKEDFIEQFWKGLSDKTRVVFISQITSSTGLIFPVQEICARAKELGLITIVDGAHVPGHIDLDLRTLQADYYTGACHKWMMTPKGSSFLYVKKEFQNALDPLVISWGYEAAMPSSSQFLDYHQFNGTRDFSAYLTIPKAIAFMEENNWKSVSADCRKLVRDNAPRFAELLGTAPLAPLTDEFFGQLCSLEIKTNAPMQLKDLLYKEYKIEIPVMVHGDKVYIRYSINAFNDQGDLDLLYAALSRIV